MRKIKSYGKKKQSKAPLVVLGIVVLAALALGIAWFWQGSETREKPPSSIEESLQQSQESSETKPPLIQESTPPPIVSVEESIEEPSSKEELSSEDSSSEEESSTEAVSTESTVDHLVFRRREEYPYALAKKETPVGADYFDDAIFLGDSISTGIPLYLRPVLGDVAVVAETGISPTNVLTQKQFDMDGKKVPMLAKAASYGQREKVYILLGGNSLGYEKAPFMKGYGEFLTAAKEQYPDAIIYVQSITPVTANATERYPDLGKGDINVKIDEYNLAIMDLCKEKGIHYLDIASVFVDEQGQLPLSASPSDGVHFGSDYYYRWYEYLRNHVA